MNTVIFSKINDYLIVTYFAEVSIDPIETQKNILKNKKQINSDNMKKYAVFFSTSGNETIISDKKYIDLKEKFDNLNENEQLTIEGEIIADYRGMIEYNKVNGIWTTNEIIDIGIVPQKTTLTAIEQTEYSAQQEKNRIDALTPAKKEVEKNMIIDVTANQAVIMRSKLEIQGEKDALQISQKWYNDELKNIEKKYGV
jgi:hypothetical protein